MDEDRKERLNAFIASAQKYPLNPTDPSPYFQQWIPSFGTVVRQVQQAWKCNFSADEICEIGLAASSVVARHKVQTLLQKAASRSKRALENFKLSEKRHSQIAKKVSELETLLSSDRKRPFSIREKSLVVLPQGYDINLLLTELKTVRTIARRDFPFEDCIRTIKLLANGGRPIEGRKRGQPKADDLYVGFVKDLIAVYSKSKGCQPTCHHNKAAPDGYSSSFFVGMALLHSALPVWAQTDPRVLGSRADQLLRRKSGSNAGLH